MMIKTTSILALACLALASLSAQWKPDVFGDDRRDLKPMADFALRDTSITRGLDGAWYMTGTVPGETDDFQNSRSIHLWRSEDLANWTEIGKVWDIARDAKGPLSRWQLEDRVNPDNPGGPLVRGIVSPEIHAFRDTYWITYSMNGQGTGLLRSRSGKPEGPYEDLGRITEGGTDASIFVDDDGSVYWVVGTGWIAKMKDDLSGLAEPLRLLRPGSFPVGHKKPSGGDTYSPRTLGQGGAHVFKANGRYWVAAAHIRDRMGVGCYDTFVMGADSLDGPFSDPMLMVPHGGQTTVFEGPDGKLHATFSGRDSRAVFQDRPAAVPLVFNGTVLYGRGKQTIGDFPRMDFNLNTEYGPWAEMEPIADVQIRDLQFSMAPDGYAYLTGSGIDNTYANRIMLFRSKDMKEWEPVEVEFDFMSIPGVTEADRAARFDDPKHQRSLGAKYMDSEIYYAEGTFHIFTSLYGGVKLPDGSNAFSGPLWLRSTSGKAEGPYEYVNRGYAQNSAFQDDDGQWYVFSNGTLQEWDPKGNALDGRRIQLKTDIGTLFPKGDVATNLAKIHGKYVVFATGWCGGTYGENYRVDGTYDWVYWQSDTLEGPYSMPRRAYAIPHAGHSSQPLQGPDGQWYNLLFGNDSTGPWWCQPGIFPVDVRLDGHDDTIRIEIAEELPR